jgi:hypothetical protein
MSVIVLPTALSLKDYAWGVIDYSLMESSSISGAEAERPLSPPRWTAHLISNDSLTPSEAARWEALILALRGDNVLALYDITNQAPRGTMRGSPTLAASVAIGATSCQINTTGTLLQGDNIGLGSGFGTSQLLKVAADASPVLSVLTVTFNNPSRRVYNSGSAVTWDKPVAYMRRTNKQATLGTWTDQGTGRGGFVIELMERFS